MKITHNKIGQNVNLTDSGKTEKASTEKVKSNGTQNPLATPAPSANTDSVKVDLSPRAQDIKRIKELANAATPDVDQAKVEKFRKLIDEGKYKVDSKAVADRLVDEHLFSTGQSSNE